MFKKFQSPEIDHKAFYRALQIFVLILVLRWIERVSYLGISYYHFPDLFKEISFSIHDGHILILGSLYFLELFGILTILSERLRVFSWFIVYGTNLLLGWESSVVGKGTKLIFPFLIIFGVLDQASKNKKRVPQLLTYFLLIFVSLMYFFSGTYKDWTGFSVVNFFNSSIGLGSWASFLDLNWPIIIFELCGLGLVLFPFFSKGHIFFKVYRICAVIFHSLILLFSKLKIFSLLCLLPWIMLRTSKQDQEELEISPRWSKIIFLSLLGIVLLTNLVQPTRSFFSKVGLDLSWNLVPRTIDNYSYSLTSGNKVIHSSQESSSFFWDNYFTDAYRYPKKLTLLQNAFCNQQKSPLLLYYKLNTQLVRGQEFSCSQ